MQINSNAVCEFSRLGMYIWGAPIEIALSLALLWFYLGNAVFAGLGALIILMPFNSYFANRFSKAHEKKLQISDSRIKILNEILNGIKVSCLIFFVKLG